MKTILYFFILTFFYTPAFGEWFWQNPLPQGNLLLSVYMVNSEVGYSVGAMGAIMKTTDGGASWKILKSGTNTNAACSILDF